MKCFWFKIHKSVPVVILLETYAGFLLMLPDTYNLKSVFTFPVSKVIYNGRAKFQNSRICCFSIFLISPSKM